MLPTTRTCFLALTALLGLAAPAFAEPAVWPPTYQRQAETSWPAGDPTWQQVDPSWLQRDWRWNQINQSVLPGQPAQLAVPQPAPNWNVDLQTALAAASAHGDLALVKALVERGANVNLRDHDGYTALTWAAQRGQANVVKYLLDHWATPNPLDTGGYTPLMWAAQEGHHETAKLLLSKGANPFVSDRRGFDALWLSRVSGNVALQTTIREAMMTSPAAKRRLPTPP
jgi:hypothetical protein